MWWRKKPVELEGEIECDEVYLVAGHKGYPEVVAEKGRKGRRRRLKGRRGRGTLAQEKPPVPGMIQRGGLVVIEMLENVRQVTIKPLLKQTIRTGSLIYTDEYNIYNRLTEWGYRHKTVNHSLGEYARDEDGDGFHEVCQHNGGFLVAASQLATPSSGYLSRKTTPLFGFL